MSGADTILLWYFVGLAAAAAAGIVLSAVAFRDLDTAIFSAVSPRHSLFFSRFIKLSFIATAVIGGLSVKFYSCEHRYDDLLKSHVTLTFKVLEEIEAGLRFLLVYLLIFFAVFLLSPLIARRR